MLFSRVTPWPGKEATSQAQVVDIYRRPHWQSLGGKSEPFLLLKAGTFKHQAFLLCPQKCLEMVKWGKKMFRNEPLGPDSCRSGFSHFSLRQSQGLS